MRPSTRSNVAFFFRGVAWVLFGLAGIAFFFGGGLIHAASIETDRTLAEFEGLALAIICLVLGRVARGAEDHFEMAQVDPSGPKSLSEALAKERKRR